LKCELAHATSGKSARCSACETRFPTPENFNVFDRINIEKRESSAHREPFRENMRDEIRRVSADACVAAPAGRW
jgi:transcriptional regulator NrdR family protein